MPEKGAAEHKRSPHGKHKEGRHRAGAIEIGAAQGRRSESKPSQCTSPPSTLVFSAFLRPRACLGGSLLPRASALWLAVGEVRLDALGGAWTAPGASKQG
jgi:hypothetical protein